MMASAAGAATGVEVAAECRRLAALSMVPEVAAKLEAWALEHGPPPPSAASKTEAVTANGGEGAAAAAAAAAPAPNVPKRRPEVVLRQYAWDQTDKALKIYVSGLAGAGEPDAEIELTPTANSVELLVKNAGGKDHRLKLGLAGEIDPATCTTKVKGARVILTLPKAGTGKWEHLLESDRVAAEAKKPKFDNDDSADPSDSIMKMMRDMYQNGDDEMRRVIGKAWTESREKTQAGL